VFSVLGMTIHLSYQSRQQLSHYEGSIEGPWDEIAIQYVLMTSHAAKKRPGEAFKEQSTLVS